MSRNTTTELINVTGSTQSATVLQAVLDSAAREVDAYLLPYGLSGATDNSCKEAELILGKAGLIDYGLHTGDYQATSGDFTSTVDAVKAIESYRKAAFTLLSQFVDSQSSRGSSKRVFGRRVNGR